MTWCVFGVDGDGCSRGIDARRSGNEARQGSEDGSQDRLIRTRRWQVQADLRFHLDHTGRDFNQPQTQSVELRHPPDRALRHRGTQDPQQPIGAGMQEQAELVGGGCRRGSGFAWRNWVLTRMANDGPHNIHAAGAHYAGRSRAVTNRPSAVAHNDRLGTVFVMMSVEKAKCCRREEHLNVSYKSSYNALRHPGVGGAIEIDERLPHTLERTKLGPILQARKGRLRSQGRPPKAEHPAPA